MKEQFIMLMFKKMQMLLYHIHIYMCYQELYNGYKQYMVKLV